MSCTYYAEYGQKPKCNHDCSKCKSYKENDRENNLFSWIHDDITWCGSECDNIKCFRHQSNRMRKTGMFSAAELKNTELCPMKECCLNCVGYLSIEKLDYTGKGCKHTNPEGHICLVCSDEGIAYWKVGINPADGLCEAYKNKWF